MAQFPGLCPFLRGGSPGHVVMDMMDTLRTSVGGSHPFAAATTKPTAEGSQHNGEVPAYKTGPPMHVKATYVREWRPLKDEEKDWNGTSRTTFDPHARVRGRSMRVIDGLYKPLLDTQIR